jgi:hypothetical protein
MTAGPILATPGPGGVRSQIRAAIDRGARRKLI